MATKMFDNTKDEFFKTFETDEHDSFIRFLDEVEDDTHWERIAAKDTYFIPLHDVALDDLSDGGTVGFEDSLGSPLPICAVMPDGRKYLMRPYLYKNIKQHHRDNAKVLGDMLNKGAIAEFCNHISASCPFLRKDILMMVRGGKVSGWFSEFNGNWSQSMQFNFFEGELFKRFPRAQFKDAEASHYFTMANYSLDESIGSCALGVSDSVMSAYADAWEKAGLPAERFRHAEPLCQFITGESGLTSIEVRPFLCVPGSSTIPLGNVLSVNHRGEDDAVWGKFETFPAQIAVFYQKGLAGLDRLCRRKVFNPFCCTTQILSMFRASIDSKALTVCAEDAGIFWPREDKDATCYAIDIFNLINEMVNSVSDKSPVRRMRNIEMVGRLLHANWDAFDVPRLGKYSGKKDVVLAVEADEAFGIG